MNQLKSLEIAWFLFLKNLKCFCYNVRMEKPNYKNKNIEIKFLKIMRTNQFLMGKDSLLELEKKSIELKDRELKDREVNIKRQIE